MPSTQTVDRFVQKVVGGDFTGAIEAFYVEGASMQENTDAPRVGRNVLVEGERQIMGAFKSIKAALVGSPLIKDDRVAICWRFEFTPFEGPARTLQEIAWQRWDGERIAEETFFYDPKQMAG